MHAISPLTWACIIESQTAAPIPLHRHPEHLPTTFSSIPPGKSPLTGTIPMIGGPSNQPTSYAKLKSFWPKSSKPTRSTCNRRRSEGLSSSPNLLSKRRVVLQVTVPYSFYSFPFPFPRMHPISLSIPFLIIAPFPYVSSRHMTQPRHILPYIVVRPTAVPCIVVQPVAVSCTVVPVVYKSVSWSHYTPTWPPCSISLFISRPSSSSLTLPPLCLAT